MSESKAAKEEDGIERKIGVSTQAKPRDKTTRYDWATYIAATQQASFLALAESTPAALPGVEEARQGAQLRPP